MTDTAQNNNKKRYAVILAGGQARRFNGEGKSDIKLGRFSLIQHVINKLKIQVDEIAISILSENKFISTLGYECIFDVFGRKNVNYGPLAGIHTSLNWVKNKSGGAFDVLTVPVDIPFLPHNLFKKLKGAKIKMSSDIAVAVSKGRKHPTIALWSSSVVRELEIAMEKGTRKIDKFTAIYNVEYVEWNDKDDPFFNINRPNDLLEAENRIKRE